MSETVWVALVAGGCTLAATYITNKSLVDREDRRRAAEIASRKALERIEKLYKPLLDMIAPGPPYDDRSIDSELAKRIIKLVDENELLASPDLLLVICRLKIEFFGGIDYVSSDLEGQLYNVAFSEVDELKELLGFGRLLKKDGAAKRYYWALVSRLKRRISRAKFKYRQWRSRRRAKRRNS